MIEVTTCPICQGTNFAFHLTCTDHSVSHETFRLLRCTSCELLITTPRPPEGDLHKYYVSQAYTSHINQGKSALDRTYLFARQFTLKWKLSLLQKYSAQKETLLDFGCGVGEFLKIAERNGWKTAGVEPSPVARQNADPIIAKNIRSSLHDILPSPNSFDAITAWHVLEHVHTLNETLESLTHLLASDGTIFIAVPNYNSWDARHYKNYWAAYDVPRHLWHFNIHSMTRLLSAHTLKVVSIVPMRLDAFYVSLLSEKYKNGAINASALTKTVVNGVRSNYSARNNTEYSSLIYIVRR
jgi:2-polyprenyl-3-methyl-5-hydroxy-6-metoxy-1,4-benzoquinol methylase